MTTSRIKEKISALVSSQLPEFIQSDFTTFVEFVEAYYKFLEQDQGASELLQNAKSYNDIDRTTTSFVEYFLETYLKNAPKSILADKRFLVKKIKAFYEAKGSELSFKVLFKMLFNENVEIKNPFDNVLRASGGKWQQSFAIQVETTSGNRNNLTNRLLTHKANGIVFKTPIIRTKILTSTLTEVFLDPNFLSSSYLVDDLVEVYENDNLVFSGTISPTTVSVRIDQPGAGFKAGQIFRVSAGGVETIIKVIRVSSTGGILNLRIINYGYGYTGFSGSNILTVAFDTNSQFTQRQTQFFTSSGGFGSSGSIVRLVFDAGSPDRYFLEDYIDNIGYATPDVTTTFRNDEFTTSSTNEQTASPFIGNLAVVTFSLGALAVYPGSYFSDQGFISEFEVRIQDDQLYQPFAYQTITNVDINLFLDVVKKLLNPAGQILYNNKTITRNFDLTNQLLIDVDRKIYFNVHDRIKLFDEDKEEVNTINDGATLFDSEYLPTFYKNLEDSNNLSDDNIYTLEKNLLDNQIINDDIFNLDITRIFENIVSAEEVFSQTIEKTFLEPDVLANLEDFNAYTLTKSVEDQIDNFIDSINLVIQNEQQDAVSIVDNTINTLTRIITNEVELADGGTIQTTISSYVDDYFSELYVIDTPITKTF